MSNSRDSRATRPASPRPGLLSVDDERRLGRLIRAGRAVPAGPDGHQPADHPDDDDVRAAEAELVEANLRLARGLARSAVRERGLDAAAAESDAMLALLRAARGFDPDRGFRFSTYATKVIQNALGESARREAVGPLEALADGASGPPGPTETCAERPAYDGGQLWGEMADPWAGPPDVVAEAADERRRLDAALGRLKPQWREVVLARAGIGEPDGAPASLRELAKRMRITFGRVRQIEAKAMSRLREVLRVDGWQEVEAAEAA